jgi:hypothetical protein
MESSVCIRDRFLTRGSREFASKSLNRIDNFLNMPAYPNGLLNRPRFEAACKVRRTRKLEILARACL